MQQPLLKGKQDTMSEKNKTKKIFKETKGKETEKKKKRQGVHLGRFSGYAPGHNPPLKAAWAPAGLVAWKTKP